LKRSEFTATQDLYISVEAKYYKKKIVGGAVEGTGMLTSIHPAELSMQY
jgi:hypothetical protein